MTLALFSTTRAGCSILDINIFKPNQNLVTPKKIELVGNTWFFVGDFNVENYGVIVTMSDD